jgi:creatinine amidohydrolase
MAEALYWPNLRRAELERLRDREAVVIVPVGSIEQHGPHCPVDVDLSIPQHIALRASAAARDLPLLVAQEIPFGFTHYNQGFIGTLSLRLETFIAVIGDIARSLKQDGFERMIFLNGHGGNHHPLRSIGIQLAEEDIYILPISHWDLVGEELKQWGDRDPGIGHGGEWETSLQLHLRPHLVDRSLQVAEQWVPSVDDRFRHFAVFAERRRETPFGVMGDPTVASAEKGARYVELAVERLVDIATAYRRQPVRRYRHHDPHTP